MGERILIRGKNLYVEQYGAGQPDALLYLHGGPGASCVDFCYHQAKVLGKSMWVVAMDQRGVLRSDSLESDEAFSLNDLIEDCEALRDRLGIQRWSVLGHSFGGYLALTYAHQYPNSIHKVLYEAPSFDTKLSTQLLVRRAYEVAKNNQLEFAEDIKAHIGKDYSARELWNIWSSIIPMLGGHKDDIYFHGINSHDYDLVYQNMTITGEEWSRSDTHNRLLVQEGRLFESLIPLLPTIKHPSLLLHGAYDPVLCEHQRKAFLEQCPAAEIVVFENSAHFPRLEEADKYTRVVEEFILSDHRRA